MRVLVIEADPIASRGLTEMLRGGGAVVEHATTGDDGLDLVRHYEFDLVLVDLALPDGDGTEVVRRMRAARIETPAVVMSAQTRAEIKVRAFGAGADDFICKPYDPAEMQARLQAIMRRSKGYSQPTLALGSLQLNLDSREVTVAGRDVHLTGKEYAILELLVLRKGMVLTKEAFLNHLYGGMDEPEMKIIDVFICKLRKKLAEAGSAEPDRHCLGPRLHGPGHRRRPLSRPSPPGAGWWRPDGTAGPATG